MQHFPDTSIRQRVPSYSTRGQPVDELLEIAQLAQFSLAVEVALLLPGPLKVDHIAAGAELLQRQHLLQRVLSVLLAPEHPLALLNSVLLAVHPPQSSHDNSKGPLPYAPQGEPPRASCTAVPAAARG
eukprot:10960-Heterococcus_DN1.PRE.1